MGAVNRAGSKDAHRGAAVGTAPVAGQDEDETQAAPSGIRQHLVQRIERHLIVHACEAS